MDDFLTRCFYHPGQYKSQDDFAALSERLSSHEKVKPCLLVMGGPCRNVAAGMETHVEEPAVWGLT